MNSGRTSRNAQYTFVGDCRVGDCLVASQPYTLMLKTVDWHLSLSLSLSVSLPFVKVGSRTDDNDKTNTLHSHKALTEGPAERNMSLMPCSPASTNCRMSTGRNDLQKDRDEDED